MTKDIMMGIKKGSTGMKLPDQGFRKSLEKDTSIQLSGVDYRDKYMKDLVKDWDNQLIILATITETQLQAAYSAFVSGFKNKLNYFMRTIPNIRHLLLPLERAVRVKFTSAVTGGHICNDKEIVLISLPTRYGRLAIPIFHETVEIRFMNSNKITSEFKALIKQQSLQ